MSPPRSLIDRLADVGIRLARLRNGEHRTACAPCDKGPKDEALAVRVDGDRAVWLCHRCQWSGSVSVERPFQPCSTNATSSTPAPSADDDTLELARRVWTEGVPLARTVGEAYLQRRACIIPPADGDVRFHPRLFCAKVSRQLPAIICRVSTVRGNVGVGIHRLFLDPLGSDSAIAKMRLGGSKEPVCIRLWPDEHVTQGLALAEGVESALAAAHLFRPIWATIDAGQMKRFPVLPGVESLTIYADHDPAGIGAASACADRWRAAGKTVSGIAPAKPGADLNDVVREACA